ncbi:MAG: CPBP family intramembrane metalloprotease [Sporichthyaceae bacterium]|nr:CPBP family intramembrane metalloprotease [Sporichthyaceae bacterium]
MISAEVYLALLVALALAFGGRAGIRDRLRLGPTSARAVGLALAAWLAALAATGAAHLVLGGVLGSPRELWDMLMRIGSDFGRLSGAGPLLIAVIALRACLLAPLGEELLFRGALFGWLRQHLNAPATIALTAVVFAAIHQTPVLLPYAFLIGTAAAWVRERTGSTTPFLAVHLLSNALLVTLAYALTGWNPSP